MRLIDADALRYQQISSSVQFVYRYEIEQQPTIDAVPVVRCKDCERRSKSADLTDTIYCKWLDLQMPKDAFCSYGERKDGEG